MYNEHVLIHTALCWRTCPQHVLSLTLHLVHSDSRQQAIGSSCSPLGSCRPRMIGMLSRKSMSHRLSVLLVVLGLAWGVMLLRYTVQQPRHQTSAEIRQQILELSHRYVRVLREESQNAPGGPQGTALAGYADLKRTIAVLLDDILSRLSKLEGKMDLMVNSSSTNSSQPAGGPLSSATLSLQKPSRQNPPSDGTGRLHPHVPNRL